MVIDDALAAFLEGAGGQYVGTVSAAGVPSAGRAWGMRLRPETGDVRLVVGRDAETIANLRSTGRIAVTVTDVNTYRSVQLKGRVVAIESLGPSDRDVCERYRRDFQAVLTVMDVKTPLDVVIGRELVAVTMELDALFDQTPGPGAGRGLVPGRA